MPSPTETTPIPPLAPRSCRRRRSTRPMSTSRCATSRSTASSSSSMPTRPSWPPRSPRPTGPRRISSSSATLTRPAPDGLPPGSLALAAADEPDDVNALGARLGQYAAARRWRDRSRDRLSRADRDDRLEPERIGRWAGDQGLHQRRAVAPDVVDVAAHGVDVAGRRPRSAASRPSSSAGSAGVGSSQRSQASSGMTTGIRSCRSAMASFGVVVTIVKVRRTVSVAGSLPARPQPGQGERPAVVAGRCGTAGGSCPRASTRRTNRPGRGSACRTKASRKAGLVVRVSARALNIREPTFASFAQCGMRPQR